MIQHQQRYMEEGGIMWEGVFCLLFYIMSAFVLQLMVFILWLTLAILLLALSWIALPEIIYNFRDWIRKIICNVRNPKPSIQTERGESKTIVRTDDLSCDAEKNGKDIRHRSTHPSKIWWASAPELEEEGLKSKYELLDDEMKDYLFGQMMKNATNNSRSLSLTAPTNVNSKVRSSKEKGNTLSTQRRLFGSKEKVELLGQGVEFSKGNTSETCKDIFLGNDKVDNESFVCSQCNHCHLTLRCHEPYVTYLDFIKATGIETLIPDYMQDANKGSGPFISSLIEENIKNFREEEDTGTKPFTSSPQQVYTEASKLVIPNQGLDIKSCEHVIPSKIEERIRDFLEKGDATDNDHFISSHEQAYPKGSKLVFPNQGLDIKDCEHEIPSWIEERIKNVLEEEDATDNKHFTSSPGQVYTKDSKIPIPNKGQDHKGCDYEIPSQEQDTRSCELHTPCLEQITKGIELIPSQEQNIKEKLLIPDLEQYANNVFLKPSQRQATQGLDLLIPSKEQDANHLTFLTPNQEQDPSASDPFIFSQEQNFKDNELNCSRNHDNIDYELVTLNQEQFTKDFLFIPRKLQDTKGLESILRQKQELQSCEFLIPSQEQSTEVLEPLIPFQDHDTKVSDLIPSQEHGTKDMFFIPSEEQVTKDYELLIPNQEQSTESHKQDIKGSHLFIPSNNGSECIFYSQEQGNATIHSQEQVMKDYELLIPNQEQSNKGHKQDIKGSQLFIPSNNNSECTFYSREQGNATIYESFSSRSKLTHATNDEPLTSNSQANTFKEPFTIVTCEHFRGTSSDFFTPSSKEDDTHAQTEECTTSTQTEKVATSTQTEEGTTSAQQVPNVMNLLFPF